MGENYTSKRKHNIYCPEKLRDTTSADRREWYNRKRHRSDQTIDKNNAQLPVCSRTIESPGFPFPNPESRQWKKAVSQLNECKQSTYEEDINRRGTGRPAETLPPSFNLDIDQNQDICGTSIRNAHGRTSSESDNGKASGPSQLSTIGKSTERPMETQGENIIIACSEESRDGSSTPIKRPNGEQGNSERRDGNQKEIQIDRQDRQPMGKEAEETIIDIDDDPFEVDTADECDDGDTIDFQPKNKNIYTFVLSKSNTITDNNGGGIRKPREPTFITFDHGTHWHCLYQCAAKTEGGGDNKSRAKSRITSFLKANNAGVAESNSTVTRVRFIRRFLEYCIRGGISTLCIYGNKKETTLKNINEAFIKIKTSETIDDIITNGECSKYIEENKSNVEKIKRQIVDKRSNLLDFIQTEVRKYKIKSIQQWKNNIDPNTKLQLIKEHGLSINAYIQSVIDIEKTITTQKIIKMSWQELIIDNKQVCIEEIRKNKNDVLSGILWIKYMCIKNKVDINELLAWATLIKNQTLTKKNSLVLEGVTNAGKSLIADTLFKDLELEEIPKERDNSTFNLDQLPAATGVIFEEPMITPTNVNTWKLILEGKKIKTDIKNLQKEEITRLSCYITTGKPIHCNVDFKEAQQLNQRIKIFKFEKHIRHWEKDTFIGENNIIKPSPVFIEPFHWYILYINNLQKIKDIVESIKNEKYNIINRNAIPDKWDTLKENTKMIIPMIKGLGEVQAEEVLDK